MERIIVRSLAILFLTLITVVSIKSMIAGLSMFGISCIWLLGLGISAIMWGKDEDFS